MTKTIKQQGKPYTKAQREVIIESLKTYLQLGYSRNKACSFVGFDPTTLNKWVMKDNALSMKLIGWENEVSILSRRNLRSSIEEKKDNNISLEWLRAKDRQEFGKNVDVTSDHKPISQIEVVYKTFGEELNADNT